MINTKHKIQSSLKHTLSSLTKLKKKIQCIYHLIRYERRIRKKKEWKEKMLGTGSYILLCFPIY